MNGISPLFLPGSPNFTIYVVKQSPTEVFASSLK